MDWNLLIAVCTQVLGFGVLYGVMKTKVDILQRDLEKIEEEVRDFRGLRSDLAVMQSQLQSIQSCLNTISRNYHNDKHIVDREQN